mgnify:CR=1 FL=1
MVKRMTIADASAFGLGLGLAIFIGGGGAVPSSLRLAPGGTAGSSGTC